MPTETSTEITKRVVADIATAEQHGYMPFGVGLLVASLIATLLAMFFFWQAEQQSKKYSPKEKFVAGPWGKRFALLSTLAIVGVEFYLLYLIGTHAYNVNYVYEYSSRRGGMWFRALWAGQEGSLLLWTFWSSILGGVLAVTAKEKTHRVWPVFGVMQLFLIATLLVKSPFITNLGAMPTDGKGINPLLDNQWMAIHPPMLLCGFASTILPAVWGIYGMLYKDNTWIKSAFSWILFSFSVLGFGLSLGGYWAYETLGWGGFWAWDSVENTSLVPWLFLTALLHTLPVQQKNGTVVKTNAFLSFIPCALMFYGTFLTRTGALTLSVHSFAQDSNQAFYYMMVGGAIASFVIPLGIFLWRRSSLHSEITKVDKAELGIKPTPLTSREFGYNMACLILGLMGLLVGIGMSAELITKIPKLFANSSSAQPEFYNQATYPLAILLTLGMAITPYLSWRATPELDKVGKKLLPSYIAAIVLALVMVGIAFSMGLRAPAQVFLFATALFAMFANFLLIIPRTKLASQRKTIGGFVAHLGAAMTMAGIAVVVAFQNQNTGVALMKGVPQTVQGATLTYLGMTSHPFDRDGNFIRIKVVQNGRQWEAQPRIYYTAWNGKDSLFGNPPAIGHFAWGDFYISFDQKQIGVFPLNEEQSPNAPFVLTPNASVQRGDYKFTLTGYDVDEAAQKISREYQGNPEGFNDAFKKLAVVRFKAKIAVEYQGSAPVTVTPAIRLEPSKDGAYSEVVEMPGPAGEKVILRYVPPTPEEMNSEISNFKFQTFNAPDASGEAIFVDVSTKPFIWLVWIGPVLFTWGGLIAYRRRAKEAGL
jgi:cytochrome c-type biogenesis protein CcmF